MKFILFTFVLNLQMAEVTDLYPPMVFDTMEECTQALDQVKDPVYYWRQPGYFDAGVLCEPIREPHIDLIKKTIYGDLRQLMNPFTGIYYR